MLSLYGLSVAYGWHNIVTEYDTRPMDGLAFLLGFACSVCIFFSGLFLLAETDDYLNGL